MTNFHRILIFSFPSLPFKGVVKTYCQIFQGYRELEQTETTTATRASANKRFNEQNNSSARALKIFVHFFIYLTAPKGPGKRGHIVADTLLPTQMFPRLPARAKFVADTNFVSQTQKMFVILFRNILCP